MKLKNLVFTLFTVFGCIALFTGSYAASFLIANGVSEKEPLSYTFSYSGSINPGETSIQDIVISSAYRSSKDCDLKFTATPTDAFPMLDVKISLNGESVGNANLKTIIDTCKAFSFSLEANSENLIKIEYLLSSDYSGDVDSLSLSVGLNIKR